MTRDVKFFLTKLDLLVTVVSLDNLSLSCEYLEEQALPAGGLSRGREEPSADTLGRLVQLSYFNT